MRIATTQYHATMNTALQSASARLEEIMQKMASGKRLLRPSDDPIANVRLSRLTREEAALDQYRDNIGALRVRLQQNETYLGSITADMLETRDLLVWASDGGNTPDDVAAMAGSIRAFVESMFYTANTRDQEGHYVFSGTATTTATLGFDEAALAGSRYSWTGNDGEQRVVVGNGVTQASNVTLAEIAAILNRLDALSEAFASGASINDPAVRAQAKDALDGLDEALASVTGKIAALGGAQNILEALENNHANVSLSNKQAIMDLGQLDYGDAAVKLNGYSVALQATQKAYAQVSRLTLFDVL